MGENGNMQLITGAIGTLFGAGLTFYIVSQTAKKQTQSQLKQSAELLASQKEQYRLERELAESKIREELTTKISENEFKWQSEQTKLQRTIEIQENTLNEHDSEADSLAKLKSHIETERRNIDHSKTMMLQQQELLETQLASVANITPQQAKELLVERTKEAHLQEAIQEGKRLYSKTLADSRSESNRALLSVMERNASDFLAEATVAIIPISNEEMKGRLIGRDGRNIRAFEQVAGVDLIIDETPEIVTISCFDPVRRETARLALMNLMIDGRIHPGRIEEVYESANLEVQRMLQDAGQKAALKAKVFELPHRVIETLGKLRLRTSYAQNVLDHSVEVSQLSANLAAELGFNVEIARKAGFLHDIGKALNEDYPGPHALAGMAFLQEFDIKPEILNAVGAHHREIAPESAESEIVIIADILSASRPGARRENLEIFTTRLEALEQIANKFEGVDRCFAVQAGREIRVIVNPVILDDIASSKLAKDIAAEIESSVDYPGQVKVTIIREMRISEIAQ